MLNLSLLHSPKPKLQLAPETPPASEGSVRLFPEEATELLKRLVRERWQRLSSEYDDPLGMLFGNRAKQWTAGWDPHSSVLYLLVWETDSWEEKPVWSLYRDGTLIFQEEDGFSQTRGNYLHQLLESEQLPFIGHSQFLEPLLDYRFVEPQRAKATQALLKTIQARPEIFANLKEPLFQALEAELRNQELPILEILKIHRLAHKNGLVDLFRHFVQDGFIRTAKDYARLDKALTLLQMDYAEQGPKISLLLQPIYLQAYNAFRQMMTSGTWRIKLRMAPAISG
jgi:hypothetical protein